MSDATTRGRNLLGKLNAYVAEMAANDEIGSGSYSDMWGLIDEAAEAVDAMVEDRPRVAGGALETALAAALEDEVINEVVKAQVRKSVARWVSDALEGYGNPIRKAFEERLAEVMVPRIERINLDNAKLDVMLSELVRETAIGERAEILGKFGRLVTGERRTVVPASEILAEYSRYVAGAYDCLGREVDFDDEPTYEALECVIELDVQDDPYGSVRKDASLRLYVEDCDEGQREDMCRALRLWRWDDLPRDRDRWYVSYPTQPTFRSIARADYFEIYLARLGSDGAYVRWDVDGLSDSVTVDPEQRPECTWE
jgi:hypothetical protein